MIRQCPKTIYQQKPSDKNSQLYILRIDANKKSSSDKSEELVYFIPYEYR